MKTSSFSIIFSLSLAQAVLAARIALDGYIDMRLLSNFAYADGRYSIFGTDGETGFSNWVDVTNTGVQSYVPTPTVTSLKRCIDATTGKTYAYASLTALGAAASTLDLYIYDSNRVLIRQETLSLNTYPLDIVCNQRLGGAYIVGIREETAGVYKPFITYVDKYRDPAILKSTYFLPNGVSIGSTNVEVVVDESNGNAVLLSRSSGATTVYVAIVSSEGSILMNTGLGVGTTAAYTMVGVGLNGDVYIGPSTLASISRYANISGVSTYQYASTDYTYYLSSSVTYDRSAWVDPFTGDLVSLVRYVNDHYIRVWNPIPSTPVLKSTVSHSNANTRRFADFYYASGNRTVGMVFDAPANNLGFSSLDTISRLITFDLDSVSGNSATAIATTSPRYTIPSNANLKFAKSFYDTYTSYNMIDANPTTGQSSVLVVKTATTAELIRYSEVGVRVSSFDITYGSGETIKDMAIEPSTSAVFVLVQKPTSPISFEIRKFNSDGSAAFSVATNPDGDTKPSFIKWHAETTSCVVLALSNRAAYSASRFSVEGRGSFDEYDSAVVVFHIRPDGSKFNVRAYHSYITTDPSLDFLRLGPGGVILAGWRPSVSYPDSTDVILASGANIARIPQQVHTTGLDGKAYSVSGTTVYRTDAFLRNGASLGPVWSSTISTVVTSGLSLFSIITDQVTGNLIKIGWKSAYVFIEIATNSNVFMSSIFVNGTSLTLQETAFAQSSGTLWLSGQFSGRALEVAHITSGTQKFLAAVEIRSSGSLATTTLASLDFNFSPLVNTNLTRLNIPSNYAIARGPGSGLAYMLMRDSTIMTWTANGVSYRDETVGGSGHMIVFDNSGDVFVAYSSSTGAISRYTAVSGLVWNAPLGSAIVVQRVVFEPVRQYIYVFFTTTGAFYYPGGALSPGGGGALVLFVLDRNGNVILRNYWPSSSSVIGASPVKSFILNPLGYVTVQFQLPSALTRTVVIDGANLYHQNTFNWDTILGTDRLGSYIISNSTSGSLKLMSPTFQTSTDLGSFWSATSQSTFSGLSLFSVFTDFADDSVIRVGTADTGLVIDIMTSTGAPVSIKRVDAWYLQIVSASLSQSTGILSLFVKYEGESFGTSYDALYKNAFIDIQIRNAVPLLTAQTLTAAQLFPINIRQGNDVVANVNFATSTRAIAFEFTAFDGTVVGSYCTAANTCFLKKWPGTSLTETASVSLDASLIPKMMAIDDSTGDYYFLISPVNAAQVNHYIYKYTSTLTSPWVSGTFSFSSSYPGYLDSIVFSKACNCAYVFGRTLGNHDSISYIGNVYRAFYTTYSTDGTRGTTALLDSSYYASTAAMISAFASVNDFITVNCRDTSNVERIRIIGPTGTVFATGTFSYQIQAFYHSGETVSLSGSYLYLSDRYFRNSVSRPLWSSQALAFNGGVAPTYFKTLIDESTGNIMVISYTLYHVIVDVTSKAGSYIKLSTFRGGNDQITPSRATFNYFEGSLWISGTLNGPAFITSTYLTGGLTYDFVAIVNIRASTPDFRIVRLSRTGAGLFETTISAQNSASIDSLDVATTAKPIRFESSIFENAFIGTFCTTSSACTLRKVSTSDVTNSLSSVVIASSNAAYLISIDESTGSSYVMINAPNVNAYYHYFFKYTSDLSNGWSSQASITMYDVGTVDSIVYNKACDCLFVFGKSRGYHDGLSYTSTPRVFYTTFLSSGARGAVTAFLDSSNYPNAAYPVRSMSSVNGFLVAWWRDYYSTSTERVNLLSPSGSSIGFSTGTSAVEAVYQTGEVISVTGSLLYLSDQYYRNAFSRNLWSNATVSSSQGSTITYYKCIIDEANSNIILVGSTTNKILVDYTTKAGLFLSSMSFDAMGVTLKHVTFDQRSGYLFFAGSHTGNPFGSGASVGNTQDFLFVKSLRTSTPTFQITASTSSLFFDALRDPLNVNVIDSQAVLATGYTAKYEFSLYDKSVTGFYCSSSSSCFYRKWNNDGFSNPLSTTASSLTTPTSIAVNSRTGESYILIASLNIIYKFNPTLSSTWSTFATFSLPNGGYLDSIVYNDGCDCLFVFGRTLGGHDGLTYIDSLYRSFYLQFTSAGAKKTAVLFDSANPAATSISIKSFSTVNGYIYCTWRYYYGSTERMIVLNSAGTSVFSSAGTLAVESMYQNGEFVSVSGSSLYVSNRYFGDPVTFNLWSPNALTLAGTTPTHFRTVVDELNGNLITVGYTSQYTLIDVKTKTGVFSSLASIRGVNVVPKHIAYDYVNGTLWISGTNAGIAYGSSSSSSSSNDFIGTVRIRSASPTFRFTAAQNANAFYDASVGVQNPRVSAVALDSTYTVVTVAHDPRSGDFHILTRQSTSATTSSYDKITAGMTLTNSPSVLPSGDRIVIDEDNGNFYVIEHNTVPYLEGWTTLDSSSATFRTNFASYDTVASSAIWTSASLYMAGATRGNWGGITYMSARQVVFINRYNFGTSSWELINSYDTSNFADVKSMHILPNTVLVRYSSGVKQWFREYGLISKAFVREKSTTLALTHTGLYPEFFYVNTTIAASPTVVSYNYDNEQSADLGLIWSAATIADVPQPKTFLEMHIDTRDGGIIVIGRTVDTIFVQKTVRGASDFSVVEIVSLKAVTFRTSTMDSARGNLWIVTTFNGGSLGVAVGSNRNVVLKVPLAKYSKPVVEEAIKSAGPEKSGSSLPLIIAITTGALFSDLIFATARAVISRIFA